MTGLAGIGAKRGGVSRFSALLALALLLVPGFAARGAEKRVALVIGNGAYRNAPGLRNPANDALAVSGALRRIGFEVVTGTDLDLQGMIEKLRAYRAASEGADIALVYYSGHGMQVAGENWLLPVSAKLDSDRDLQYEGVKVESVLDEAEGAHKLRLVILDACRDNPFAAKLARSMGATRSAALGRGFARIEPKGGGSLIAYATRAGDVASDGTGGNSPFTAAFLKHLETPGIEVRLFFGKVHDSVVDATGGQQEPAIYGSLGGDPIYLSGGAPAPATTQTPGTEAVNAETELAFWNSVKDEKNPDAFREYRKQYPNGRFIGLADLRLKQMSDGSAAAPEKPAEEGSVTGAIASYSPESWPVVAGKTIRLFGLQSFPVKNVDFFKWLGLHVTSLTCEPKPNGTYRCLTQDNVDLSQTILINGGSRVSKDATADYQEFERKAQQEKRGIWDGRKRKS